ncbi:MAG: hypothetical protein DWQ06_11335 [Calditrichaeota bacterium]|nr:MAG: hypothetical protein DWQ06_11335 [Calditrichota bacterium]
MFFFPIFGYAEIHYRFKYFFSYLKTKEPEILADAPYRIEPNQKIPVLFLLKDSDSYPITLTKISVEITLGESKKVEVFYFNEKINSQFWWKVEDIEPLGIGKHFLNVTFHWENSQGKSQKATNDNYKGLSNSPLETFVAEENLPKFEDFYFGECHCHTNLTSDQVEYGAPIEASKLLSKPIGLDFYTTTDHSYDLDDKWENYLETSPTLEKWKFLQNEVTRLNSQNDNFVVVRGEEATCENSLGKNVHLLVYGNQKFFYGSGDSAEKWFQTDSENSISQILQNLESKSVAFAAHPGCEAPTLEKLLINRGEWNLDDFCTEGLNGVQILNGTLDHSFEVGKKRWIQSLLKGKKISIIAGNDAHGNFNRFRQVSFPFFKMTEHNEQIFGKVKTFLKIRDYFSEDSILEAFKLGKTGLSTGVIADFEFLTENGNFTFGDTTTETKGTISFTAKSSKEFGMITKITMLSGNYTTQDEHAIKEIAPNSYFFADRFDLDFQEDYIRFEGETESGSIFMLTPLYRENCETIDEEVDFEGFS